MRPRLNIEIHEIHKMYKIHLPKNRNPQHLGLHEIHGVTVEINTDFIWSLTCIALLVPRILGCLSYWLYCSSFMFLLCMYLLCSL